MRADEGIDGFAALLGKAGLELGAEEMADALWLAEHISPGVSEQVVEEEKSKEEKPIKPTAPKGFLDSASKDKDNDAQFLLSLEKSDEAEGDSAKSDSIPIKVPAAPALRIRLKLARALRPLRRHLPSPVRTEFDQAGTIERIADQGIWSPVLSPAPERWLEVALVIEESESIPLWKETLIEFQTLLERQGTFRNVNLWRLKSSDETSKLTLLSGRSNRARSARELLDPTGRRLILLASDCTSIAWQQGAIYSWLETWSKKAPMTVIQLLPERLWAQTGLAQGVPVWLSSLEPGIPNEQMIAKAQMPLWDLFWSEQAQIKVPVVSLEAEPLKRWASVIAGAGDNQTTGFRFGKKENLEGRNQELEELPELNAEERLRLFRATASITAQKLAGLMSAVPVNPSIVNLIRQTMLPEAEPVHVAEVYMGGLIESQEHGEYDFIPYVRNRLLEAVSVTDTERVLNSVSSYVAKRLNLNTQSFEALLSFDFGNDPEIESIMTPFAKVAIQTLRGMGLDYAAIATQIQTQSKTVSPSFEVEDNEDTSDENHSLDVTYQAAKFDLNVPLHELFWEIYDAMIARSLVGFSKLKYVVIHFEPIESKKISTDIKRKLCRFLEEALGNVGKHAIGATHLVVIGKKKDHQYELTIADNGPGLGPSNIGVGTRISEEVARLVQGTFVRKPNKPKGSFCQLTFPIAREKPAQRAIILTAMPVEFKAVRALLTNSQRVKHPEGNIYERGMFTANGRTWNVGIAEIGKGDPTAAMQTERAITFFNPDVILFVGVAGGMKDVKIGDVVASTKIYGYESGKVAETFKARPEIGLSSFALVEEAKAEVRSEEQAWLKRLANTTDVVPRAWVGPIAAGEKVIVSNKFSVYKFLMDEYSDSLAVEMEGYGFLQTVQKRQKPVSAIVVRGISDLIDSRNDDPNQEPEEIRQATAAFHASAFAFQLLANFEPMKSLVT